MDEFEVEVEVEVKEMVTIIFDLEKYREVADKDRENYIKRIVDDNLNEGMERVTKISEIKSKLGEVLDEYEVEVKVKVKAEKTVTITFELEKYCDAADDPYGLHADEDRKNYIKKIVTHSLKEDMKRITRINEIKSELDEALNEYLDNISEYDSYPNKRDYDAEDEDSF